MSAGKSVLVTGAGGSIGSRICERIVRGGAKRLTMVSLTENGLYTINRHLRSFAHDCELVPLLGSVGDACLMRRALAGVDTVIHAAAHKHVPICEQNPAEAIRNNVFGTLTLATLAVEAGVERFCLISSDKAVQPASIMGATKRLAEMIVAASSEEQRATRFITVRFGNVLDSAGSVLPLWREQIRAGGPLTLTDERCERFFMSIDQAVGLVLGVIEQGAPGTYVLDMGKPHRLVDMARDLLEQMGANVQIRYIGLRPGEKLTEELHHGGELRPTSAAGVFQVIDEVRAPKSSTLRALESACDGCDAGEATRLLWSAVGG